MPRWKKFIQSVKDFPRDVYLAPSSRQTRLLITAVDRIEQYGLTRAEADLDAAMLALKEVLNNFLRDPEIKATFYISLATHLIAMYCIAKAGEPLGEAIRAFRASITLTKQHKPVLAERLESMWHWLTLRLVKNPCGGDDVEAIEISKQGLVVPQLATSTRIKLLNTLIAIKMTPTKKKKNHNVLFRRRSKQRV